MREVRLYAICNVNSFGFWRAYECGRSGRALEGGFTPDEIEEYIYCME